MQLDEFGQLYTITITMTTKLQNLSLSLQCSLCLLHDTRPSSHPQPPATTVLLSLTIVLLKSHIIKITQYIAFCVSLFHLEFLRFIPVLSIIMYHPPLVSDYYSILHNLFACSSADGPLDFFQFWAGMFPHFYGNI